MKELINKYVLGFVFDLNDRVLLITKNRPEWQDGLLNGLGGHVEEGEGQRPEGLRPEGLRPESPHHAMQREGSEETCGKLANVDWKLYGRLRGSGFEMWLFCVQVPWAGLMGLDGVSTEEGRCSFVYLEDLPGFATVPNVEYLVAMARTHLAGRDRCKFYEIGAKSEVIRRR